MTLWSTLEEKEIIEFWAMVLLEQQLARSDKKVSADGITGAKSFPLSLKKRKTNLMPRETCLKIIPNFFFCQNWI